MGENPAVVAVGVGGVLGAGVALGLITPDEARRQAQQLGQSIEQSIAQTALLLKSYVMLPQILLNESADNAEEPEQCERPEGVPDHWVETPSQKKGGKRYTNPENANEGVRVMPGDKNSPNPSQQGPYVKQTKPNGQYVDVNGNEVPKNSPEAHIPAKDYTFQRW